MNEKGLTLVEILASITILSIIIVSLLSMFIQSSRSNQYSENILNATYVAQSQLEEIINLSHVPGITSLDGLLKLLKEEGYILDNECNNCYGIVQNEDDRYVLIQLTNKSRNLGKVLVKVFDDQTKTRQEAQMEMVFQWN